MAYVNSLLLFTFIISYLWTTTALNSTCILFENRLWMNNNQSLPSTVHFTDGSVSRFILLRERRVNGSQFGFGLCFYCTASSRGACYLSMVFVEMSNGIILRQPPQVIWSANRDKPVGEDAILSFSRGSLVLSIIDELGLWSTYTTGWLVSNLTITNQGNLVLLNESGEIVWQSFDQFTDTLVDGQKLREGQRLISNSVSSKTMRSGIFYATIYGGTLSAFVDGDKPRSYAFVSPADTLTVPDVFVLESVQFKKGKIIFFYILAHYIRKFTVVETSSNSSTVQILRLDADGGLRIYGWEAGKGWRKAFAFSGESDECRFPLFCGRYGVCQGGNCTCPVAVDGVQFFIPTDTGCQLIYDPPSLGTSDHYQLVNFGNLSYYNLFDKYQAIQGIADEVSCTKICSRNSACKAAFFIYEIPSRKGYCYSTTDVLSLREADPALNSSYSSTHIKVLVHSKSSISLILILLVACAFILFMLLIVAFVYMLDLKKKQNDDCQDFETDETLKLVSEFPMRFSYRELSIATAKFSEKLGGGGFGTVFKGVLKNGTVVAVKRLDRSGQGTKEFVAEVETIGNIHHINLVRLIGFCASKRQRMLVYEYMSNGSLDRWIFCENQDATLGWNIKKKIMVDIAKGLTYLHEECTQKIAHLDVKPQNILLDDDFHAKLSDFGMSKLISRDESQVVTGIRGTLGYLAPEWQHSRITVKADIYSFGIVLLEIISGRKILDYSQPNSEVHLLSLFRKKASENRLTDVVACKDRGKEGHIEEAIEMIKLGMWCLNSDYTRRPSMSLVVKILEGVIPLEMNGQLTFPN